MMISLLLMIMNNSFQRISYEFNDLRYRYNNQESIMSKKINARIVKWRSMISEGVYRDPIILKSRIRKGIPTAVRSIAWPEIIHLQTFIKSQSSKYTFEALINKPSHATYEISLDIPRTFPEQDDTKILRKSLNNVLKAISIVYPKVGYCQGMNFLALRLLQIVNDEQAFWIINYLFSKDPYLIKNFINPKRIEEQTFVFVQLMKQFLPKISNQFQIQNIAPQIYTVKWFMTLFSSVFSQQLFYRVFEVFLNEGWPAIFSTGIALIGSSEQKILKNSFEENLFLLNSEIYHVPNIDDFMDIVFKYDITTPMIQKHLKTFRSAQQQKKQANVSQRNSHARLHDLHRPILPIPQEEETILQQFQSKSEEITFEAFVMLMGQKIINKRE